VFIYQDMEEIFAIKKQILELVKPTLKDREKYKKKLSKIIQKIMKYSKKKNIPLNKVVVAGSFARNTSLKDNTDFDLFLLFDKNVELNKIVEYNKKIIYSCFWNRRLVESYSEHPYVQYQRKKYKIDFVPAYEIKDYKERKTAVDRTPLHLKYLQENMSDKQRNDVLVLKQFLKNNLLYGSDQNISGFSGYLVEIMILYYKDFENFLVHFPKLKGESRIVLEKDGKKEYSDPLIVIDPVDPNRNVAAALSLKQFERTKKLCKIFSEKPSREFFFSDPEPNLEKVLVYKTKKPEKNTDISYGMVNRTLKRIKTTLPEINETNSYIDSDLYLVFSLSKLELEKTFEVKGPSAKDIENGKKFKEKHPIVYEKNGLLFAKEENKETDVEKIIESQVIQYFGKSKKITKIDADKIILKKKILEAKGLINL